MLSFVTCSIGGSFLVDPFMDFYTRNNPNTSFEMVIVVDNRLGDEDWASWEKAKSNWGDNLVLVDFPKKRTREYLLRSIQRYRTFPTIFPKDFLDTLSLNAEDYRKGRFPDNDKFLFVNIGRLYNAGLKVAKYDNICCGPFDFLYNFDFGEAVQQLSPLTPYLKPNGILTKVPLSNIPLTPFKGPRFEAWHGVHLFKKSLLERNPRIEGFSEEWIGRAFADDKFKKTFEELWGNGRCSLDFVMNNHHAYRKEHPLLDRGKEVFLWGDYPEERIKGIVKDFRKQFAGDLNHVKILPDVKG